MVEDLRLRQHPVRVEHQVVQQIELGGGEVNLLLAKEHLMGVGIQAQIVHPQNSSIFLLQ